MTLNLHVFGNAYELQGFDSATLWFAWLLPKPMYIKFIKAVRILSLYCHQETRVNLTHIYTLLRVHCKYKFIMIKMLLSRLSAMGVGHQARLHELLLFFFFSKTPVLLFSLASLFLNLQ